MDELGINASRKNSFAYLQDTTGSASTNYENDAIDFELSETKAEEYSDGFSSDWEEVKPEVNNWGSYTFSLGMGASLTMDKIPDGIQVRINKETGDIIIIGAKDARLSYQKPDNIKISVINSDMDEISIGSGADSLILSDSNADSISVSCKNTIINDSRVDKIYGGSNDEYIEINNSKVDSINSNKGHDEIQINNSEIKNIDGGKGNDEILIYDSKVTGTIKGNDGDDHIQANRSHINYIGGNNGDDVFDLSNSKIDTIEGGKGNDRFLLSNIQLIKADGGKGNDTFDIRQTQHGLIYGGKGADNFFVYNSKVNITQDSKDSIEETDTSNLSPYDIYSEDTAAIAEEITDKQSCSLQNSDLSNAEELDANEQMEVITLKFLQEQYDNMYSQFNAQENKDGAIRDGYNFIKELMNIGVSKEDIKKAIDEQKQMIDELTAAINGESKESFEDCFKRWTGKDFNIDNICEYNKYSTLYQYAMNSCTRIQMLENNAVNCDNLNEVFDIYKTFYGNEETGSEEKAREELNKTLQECKISGNIILQLDKNNNFYIANLDEMIDLYSSILEEDCVRQKIEDHINNSEFIGDYKIKLTDDYKIVYTKKTLDEEKYEYCGMEEYIYEDVPFSIEAAGNIFKGGINKSNQEALERNFLDDLECGLGMSLKSLQEKYANSQVLALGSQSSFQKLIDNYCKDQDGFADKVGSIVQFAGMGMMVIGGVVSFVSPPVGYGILKAGQFTALAGFFTDNALDLADDFMSENNISKDSFDDFLSETLKEILLITSGMGINGYAYGVGKQVYNATQKKVLAFLAEIGTDAALSIITDFAITGDIDISGEGLSQLMGIITGITGARIKQYKQDAFTEAYKLFTDGDVDGAFEYIKSKGISNKDIYKNFKEIEINRIKNEYLKSNDYTKAMKMVEDSKFLQLKGSENLSEIKTEVGNAIKQAEITKIYDMMTSPQYDIKQIHDYAESLKIFTDDEIDIFTLGKKTNNYIDELNTKYNIDYSKYKNTIFFSDQGKLIAKDIELVYKSKVTGVPIEDYLVPHKATVEDALGTLKVGDVFEVEGQKNIFIKTANGAYEQLNISKSTYNKLFPAVDRFTSGQQYSGDCYLVASLFTMFSDSTARKYLLECISEADDGSITIELPGAFTKVTLNPDQKITDIGISESNVTYGALGMQLLETAYKAERANVYLDTAQSNVKAVQAEMADFYNKYKDLADTRNIPDFESLNSYVSNAVEDTVASINYTYNTHLTSDSVIKLFKLCTDSKYINSDGMLNENGIKEFKNILGIYKTETILDIYKNEIKTEFHEPLINNNKILNEYDKMQELDNRYFEENKKFHEKEDLIEKASGQGGQPSDVYRAFGLKNPYSEYISQSKLFDDIIKNPDTQKNYVITAATKLNVDNPNLAGNHAYSIEVKKNLQGETIIIVTNPWTYNSSKPKFYALTVEEFKKYFDFIYIAEKE